jgi:hypothetical protein
VKHPKKMTESDRRRLRQAQRGLSRGGHEDSTDRVIALAIANTEASNAWRTDKEADNSGLAPQDARETGEIPGHGPQEKRP